MAIFKIMKPNDLHDVFELDNGSCYDHICQLTEFLSTHAEDVSLSTWLAILDTSGFDNLMHNNAFQLAMMESDLAPTLMYFQEEFPNGEKKDLTHFLVNLFFPGLLDTFDILLPSLDSLEDTLPSLDNTTYAMENFMTNSSDMTTVSEDKQHAANEIAKNESSKKMDVAFPKFKLAMKKRKCEDLHDAFAFGGENDKNMTPTPFVSNVYKLAVRKKKAALEAVDFNSINCRLFHD